MDVEHIIAGLGFLFTVFGFAVNWLRQSINKNEEEIRLMEKGLDKHMLHVSNNFSTKDEVVKMIGLISSPIQASVESLKEQMKEDKGDAKAELNKLSNKIDQLLAGQASRRNDD